MNWSSIRYFKEEEFRCKCGCGGAAMDETFVRMIDTLRHEYGRPLKVNSGYRCPNHNAKVSGTGMTGPHTTGKAVDLGVFGPDADRLLELAYKVGFNGKGINQKGVLGGRFIHLDMLDKRIWSY